MWYDERSVSWNNMKMSSMIVEEWRDLWSFKLDFLVAAFTYVFATTNLLNLPRLIIENGGLAFVAAYLAALFVCVLPIIVLELAVGQMTGRAPVQAFYNICPLFKGVGVAQCLFSLAIMSFLAFYVGWLMLFLYHLLASVYLQRDGLPWLDCDGADFPEFLNNIPCFNVGPLANYNQSDRFNVDHAQSALSQFISTIQRPSNDITEIGEFQIYLLAALGAVWILIFLAIFAGVRWLGKVIHFTFLLPFILLGAFLTRSLTLEGLMDILEYFYSTTDWNRMLDYEMWSKAIEQAIWATGIGFGAFITIGSYNKRTNNLVGDSLLIIIVHILLTCMQVMSIVGLVGYVSFRTSLSPIDLLSKGETQMWHLLAYVSYLPMTKLWSGIILVLSIFVLLNIFYLLTLTMLSTMEDAFGEKCSKCLPRLVCALFVCSLGYASGLFYTTQAGRYAIELVRGYLDYVTLWTILTFELLAVAWFYCAHQLGNNLRSMLPNACCWVLGHFILYFTYLLPIVPIFIMLLKIMHYNYSDTYSNGIRSWQWSEYVGWTIALVPLLSIPLLMIVTIIKKCVRGPGITKWQRFKYTIISPLRYEIVKPSGSGSHHQRYTASAPGYVLLPQAPLAEPEQYNDAGGPYSERIVRVSNI